MTSYTRTSDKARDNFVKVFEGTKKTGRLITAAPKK